MVRTADPTTIGPHSGPYEAGRRAARLGAREMWYFAWLLGVLLAVAFGIINVMWYESEQCFGQADDEGQRTAAGSRAG